jgi:hypothetical protein
MGMIEYNGLGPVWYVVARGYPTALMAEKAWEKGNAKLVYGDEESGVGIVRLGPRPEGGIPCGITDHSVVCVTLNKGAAEKAERILGGEDQSPNENFIQALILRRMRVIAENADRTGRLVIRRAENRGASVDVHGNLYEQIGQDG